MNRIQIAAFDLDGTLAPIGKRISDADIERLHKLEEMGVRICLCSGKTAFYLCGLLRQLELRHPLIVGENGAVIQEGYCLPPEKYIANRGSAAAIRSITHLRNCFDAEIPDIYYQPNDVGLTPFPRSAEESDHFAEIIEREREHTEDVIIYRHVDSYDITPVGVDKEAGIRLLAKMTGVSTENMVAVGDGINDVPMFRAAGLAIGIRLKNEYTDMTFDTVSEALDYLLEIAGRQYAEDRKDSK